MKSTTRAAHGLFLVASLFITTVLSDGGLANARPQRQGSPGLRKHDNSLAHRASPIYTIRLAPGTTQPGTAPSARTPVHASTGGKALQPRTVLMASPPYENLVLSTSELEMRAEDLSMRKMHRESAAVFRQLVNMGRTAEQQNYYAGKLAEEEGRPHDGLGYFEQAKPWFSSGQADLLPVVQHYMSDNLEDDALTLIETCADEPRSEELTKLEATLLTRTLSDTQIQEFIKDCGHFPKSCMPLKICFVQHSTAADAGRRKLLLRAFDAWVIASQGAVSYVETHDSKRANITMEWRPFNRKTDQEAHGVRVMGLTQFEAGENKHVRYADICLHLVSGSGYKFGTDYATCLHEIGHALGIWEHPKKAASVMISQHSQDVDKLPQMDQRLIFALYHRPEAQLASADQWRSHADLSTSAHVRNIE